MKNKKYLVKIDSTHGATVHIGINSDNVKPVFVYYCGRDTGRRGRRRCRDSLRGIQRPAPGVYRYIPDKTT